ncbi:hypothetical protein EV143_1202 [Flavobacterium chryseum]|uniref:hypothetical protein n=1 Tax=Flavobacterium sp. P3160 TaxID=2512113 RepID=UPI00105D7511|nr:hypothetical protein [Flavobacterium sp. P3160]TDO68740.1 hypothetical protein EV143_1202 [Flavobacterium sp. P3160]
MVYQECKNKKTSKKNTGAKEQCLEGLTIKTAAHVPGFSFPTIADAKNKALWNAAVAAKKIIPLYEVEELASANTEDTNFDGRRKQYRTASGKKVSTYSSFLSLCSHSALKSYHGDDMGLFEFTEDGAVIGVINDDGTVKGQSVVMNVGKRISATADRPPSTQVTINYKDFNELEDDGAIFRPESWGADDIFGIFDVTLTQVSATTTEIKFKAAAGCAGGDEEITSFLAANIVLKDLDGATESVTFVPADAEGIYTITGTGFADGFTLGLNGVVSQTGTGTSYEAPIPLIIELD